MTVKIQASEISDIIKKRIESTDLDSQARSEGTIVSVKDGIVSVFGLSDVMFGEVISFGDNTYGLAFKLRA